ncbi:hypothetical protein EI94DRAFT_1235323 [Lactarius quietus]|nr:hypothetical protein EI94DRAFT_1235323 [Lactarius quietus]
MDMAQQKPVISHSEAPVSGDVLHGPRASSPVSTYSGSSPGTSQGKASMDADRNARPFPNDFIHTTTHDIFLTVPNRRAATASFTSPSQLAAADPIPSNVVNGSHAYNSFPNSLMSVLTDGLDDDHARSIATGLVVADSTSQSPSDSRQPVSLYPLPPLPHSPTSLSGRPRANTTPRVGFADVLSSELEHPLPSPDLAMHHPASLIPGSPAYRTVTQHLPPVPFFLPKFSIEGVPARLSPAIITRQPQHPILSLPPISSTSSPSNVPRHRSQSLRSMPALPREGTEDPDPAEHDNASLDDLDEEEEGTGDEDDEAEADVEAAVTEHPDTLSEDGESVSSPRSSVILQTSHQGIFPTVEVSPLDMSFLDNNNGPTHRRDDKTPENSQKKDYFSFSLPDPGPSRSPLHKARQFHAAWASTRTSPVLHTSTPSPNMLAAAIAPTPRVLPTPSTPTLDARPSMYHQGSRSMVDVSQILKNEQRNSEVVVKTPKSPLRSPTAEPDTTSISAPNDDPETVLGPSLRRRLSMPTFGPSSSPPPYPQFRFGESGPAIQPRDEEGCERLPRYTNDIYLRAIMLRKMEFTSPGVQARDRKWRRTLCVLEGTAFRVYKCPPAAAGKGLIGNLWEKTVGVGDIATPPTPASVATTKANREERERERERRAGDAKLGCAEGAPPQSPSSPTSPFAGTSSTVANGQVSQPSPSTPRSRLLPSNFRKRKRMASDAQSTSRSEGSARGSLSNLRTVSSHSGFRSSPRTASGMSLPSSASSPNPCSTTTEPASPVIGSSRTPRQSRVKRRHLWVDDPAVPQPESQDLLHVYALHNSESGLGTDYVKRQNVIRIRMEGQQFLLQARDVASVVDWIEGFQAAANIAQDLDVRPMPKGPLFPRHFRRRRRRNRAQAQVASTSATI